ncbi:MAG TPA: long-chain fatty acid--CoA ligase [Actinomycetota bacterium]|nr:long-chain fatty acid--CoA ligase [Actinomycetota bacterium]
MRGLMQHDSLVLTRILERAATYFPRSGIATRTSDGMHRERYADLGERSARLANALTGLGVGPGDRVGSFAFNSWRHHELYFAVPCMGSVLHTLNIRLHPEQVAWIANHAEDRVICVDAALLPVFEQIRPALTTVEHVVVMGSAADAPEGALDYETLLADASPEIEWPTLDEDDACSMAYTSGTTGNPKGVVYSHRSMVLHAWSVDLAASIGLQPHDVVMPVVPMFHANAWGLPYAATLSGARLVYPGQYSADPAALASLIEDERVTITAGVPTVWLGLLAHLDGNEVDLSSLRAVIGGGSAVPKSMIERFAARGIEVWQGWGMTETGPLASLSRLLPAHDELPEDERVRIRARQGLAVAGIRVRVVDVGTGEDVPWDGKAMGEIQVKGNWVAEAYYRPDGPVEQFVDGWLRTGDVAVVDEHGYLQLVDRTKDLVKSGGEWISTIELESALMGHSAVAEAAVIAIPDDRWSERPLACVVLKPNASATQEELLEFIAPQFAKWWLPDRVEFVSEIPKTSVGKFDKKVLRTQFRS